ncbi:MAG: FdrA family protein [Actinomycetota bacterium]
MTSRLVLHRGAYYDSVALMLASRDAEAIEGVELVAAVAGTPVNITLLHDQGFEPPDDVGPNDMVVAIRAADDDAATAAERAVDRRLSERAEPSGAAVFAPRSIRSAVRANPDLKVAFVSVPGRYAAYEVAEAIEAGLHVFCFSDGMSLDDEAELKRRALDRGLLFLGADCGTAIVDGVGFGFANVVERGPVGIIGASGTGIQQVTCLLDAAGIGISQALGVGGRDLSTEVGGIMSDRCLQVLADDASTEIIVLVSKPPGGAVAEKIVAAAARTGKPAVVGLLAGAGDSELPAAPEGVTVVGSLEDAAAAAADLAGGRVETHDIEPPPRSTPGGLRGLFCGGSLCFEAHAATGGGDFIDFGADEYTTGRAHPMIDPTLRNDHFEKTSVDMGVGAIVLDVVLGAGAHPDPAGELAPSIEAVLERRRDLTIIVAVCGTGRDPQELGRQVKQLTAAGALVTRNAAHAGRLARGAVGTSL